jgi:hypothetical protein
MIDRITDYRAARRGDAADGRMSRQAAMKEGDAANTATSCFRATRQRHRYRFAYLVADRQGEKNPRQ